MSIIITNNNNNDDDVASVERDEMISFDTKATEAEYSALEELAHSQQEVEHDLTKWKAVRLYPRILLWILALIWVMILVGYDGQAGGIIVSIPQFRQDFGYLYGGDYVLDGDWQSAINGAPTGGMAIGTFLGSYLSDKYGRKWVIFASVLLTIPFIAVEYVAVTIKVFFVGKFLNSFCLGAMVSAGSTFIGEISPLALRAMASSSVNLALCIGPFICYLINNTTSTYTSRMSYRSIFIPQWVFGIISLCFLPFIPESPYWLIMHGKDEKAIKNLNRYFPTEEIAQRQYAILKVTYTEAQEAAHMTGSFFDMFKKANLRRTMNAVMIFFMQPMSGVTFISNYSTYYYQLSGFSTKQSYQISCGAQLLSVSGTIASWFITDRFGRRVVTLYGMISLSILNIITAGLGIKKNNRSMLTGASAFMCMYNFFYNSGIGPISYVITTENPTSTLRAKTISLGIIINYAFQCMWQFVLPFMFNPDQANMGSTINFIFGGFCLISVVYFYFLLPETANRSYEEIDEMYNNNVPARKFSQYGRQKEADHIEVQLDDVKGNFEHAEAASASEHAA